MFLCCPIYPRPRKYVHLVGYMMRGDSTERLNYGREKKFRREPPINKTDDLDGTQVILNIPYLGLPMSYNSLKKNIVNRYKEPSIILYNEAYTYKFLSGIRLDTFLANISRTFTSYIGC